MPFDFCLSKNVKSFWESCSVSEKKKIEFIIYSLILQDPVGNSIAVYVPSLSRYGLRKVVRDGFVVIFGFDRRRGEIRIASCRRLE